MEREPVDAELAGADAKRAELDDTAAKSHVAIAEAIVAIDREVGELIERRAAVAATIDATIRETYERIRTRNGGVGAAKLEHGTCMSCRLKLSAVQLDQLRKVPESDVAFCEECGSILVR